MNWSTIYITGRADFREEVKKRLENSDLKYMPGYLDSSAGRGVYDLYWLDDQEELREFKSAIGSKLVWKYRLRFFDNLEEFLDSINQKSDEMYEVPGGQLLHPAA